MIYTRKSNKPDFIKMKNFCFAKDMVKGMKGQARDWEEIFANHNLTKNLYPEFIKYWKLGTSLVVQWLRLHAPNGGGLGSIPGRGTRIPHTATKPAHRNYWVHVL